MSSEIEKTLIEKLRALPPEQQRRVLEFAEDLAQGEAPTPDSRPIWDVIAEISAQVLEEEWEKVPSDGAQQHDHYLYGAPKRESFCF